MVKLVDERGQILQLTRIYIQREGNKHSPFTVLFFTFYECLLHV